LFYFCKKRKARGFIVTKNIKTWKNAGTHFNAFVLVIVYIDSVVYLKVCNLSETGYYGSDLYYWVNFEFYF